MHSSPGVSESWGSSLARRICGFYQYFIYSAVSWLSHSVNNSICNVTRIKSLDVVTNFKFFSSLVKVKENISKLPFLFSVGNKKNDNDSSPENWEFENGNFTLKTRQMFHENETITGHFVFVFDESSVREIIWFSCPPSFSKSSVLKLFSVHTQMESQCFQIASVYRAFSKSSVFATD